jgi:hypothetical protein
MALIVRYPGQPSQVAENALLAVFSHSLTHKPLPAAVVAYTVWGVLGQPHRFGQSYRLGPLSSTNGALFWSLGCRESEPEGREVLNDMRLLGLGWLGVFIKSGCTRRGVTKLAHSMSCKRAVFREKSAHGDELSLPSARTAMVRPLFRL